MIWFITLTALGLAVLSEWLWWRAGQYQPPSSPAAIELAAMLRAARIRQMTNAAEDYMDEFVAKRQQEPSYLEPNWPTVIEADWKDWQ